MNPVPRMIPAAKHFTIMKRSFSGLRAGTERVTKGRVMPIMLEAKMVNMAMIFRGRAFFLLLQLFLDSASQSAVAWGVRRVKIIKKTKIVLNRVSEVAIVCSCFFHKLKDTSHLYLYILLLIELLYIDFTIALFVFIQELIVAGKLLIYS